MWSNQQLLFFLVEVFLSHCNVLFVHSIRNKVLDALEVAKLHFFIVLFVPFYHQSKIISNLLVIFI